MQTSHVGRLIDAAREYHDSADEALHSVSQTLARQEDTDAHNGPDAAVEDVVLCCRRQQQCLDELLSAVYALERMRQQSIRATGAMLERIQRGFAADVAEPGPTARVAELDVGDEFIDSGIRWRVAEVAPDEVVAHDQGGYTIRRYHDPRTAAKSGDYSVDRVVEDVHRAGAGG